MGRERYELTAYGYLSKHNSAQDDKDARAWNEFVAAVEKLAENPRYANIDLDINGWPAYEHGWPEGEEDGS